jgi:hypothetical protein
MEYSLAPCNTVQGNWVHELVESVAQSGSAGEESHTLGSHGEREDLDRVRDGERRVCNVVEAEVTGLNRVSPGHLTSANLPLARLT